MSKVTIISETKTVRQECADGAPAVRAGVKHSHLMDARLHRLACELEKHVRAFVASTTTVPCSVIPFRPGDR